MKSDVSDTCVVSSYFNPSKSSFRQRNLEAFADDMARVGAPLYLARIGDDSGTDAVKASGVFYFQAESILWQKERLLNLIIRRLPRRYTKIVWADCDVLFLDPNWLRKTSQLLERYSVIQPFTIAIRLPRDKLCYSGQGERLSSYGSFPGHSSSPSSPARHGHSGFAWAGHREMIESCGLYDVCLSGSGDHLMAHGFSDDLNSSCIERMFGSAVAYRRHFEQWARKVSIFTQGRVSCISGTLLHMWHGDPDTRQYELRDHELAAFAFDPAKDLSSTTSGLWAIAGDSEPLAHWAAKYLVTTKTK